MNNQRLYNAALAFIAIAAVSFGSTSLFAQAASELEATTDTGVPEGFTEQKWTQASGTARVVERENGEDVIRLEAEGLVPDGIYTVWWVNPRIIGMDMGPGGGLPQNTFTADHEGKAEARLTVSSDNDYQMMVIAYHADHRLHGEKPGEMGEETFEHIKGDWPRQEREFTGPRGRR